MGSDDIQNLGDLKSGYDYCLLCTSLHVIGKKLSPLHTNPFLLLLIFSTKIHRLHICLPPALVAPFVFILAVHQASCLTITTSQTIERALILFHRSRPADPAHSCNEFLTLSSDTTCWEAKAKQSNYMGNWLARFQHMYGNFRKKIVIYLSRNCFGKKLFI
jgi:hypothetical protein